MVIKNCQPRYCLGLLKYRYVKKHKIDFNKKKVLKTEQFLHSGTN